MTNKHDRDPVDHYWRANSDYRKQVALALELLLRKTDIKPSQISAEATLLGGNLTIKNVLHLRDTGRELWQRAGTVAEILKLAVEAPRMRPHGKFQLVADAMLALRPAAAESDPELKDLLASVEIAGRAYAELRTHVGPTATPLVTTAADGSRSGLSDKQARSPMIRALYGGGIAISPNLPEATVQALHAAVVGTYDTFRFRFSENPTKPIAREEMNIFVRDGELLYQHWHRPGGELPAQSFDGVVSLVGQVIWMIGHVRGALDRLRVLNFKFNNQRLPRYSKLHWGIMLSDQSRTSHEPAAARILVVRRGARLALPKMEERAEFMAVDDVKDPLLRRIIHRFTDNRDTASSVPNTIAPSHDENGKHVSDSILKVDQNSVDNAAQLSENLI